MPIPWNALQAWNRNNELQLAMLVLALVIYVSEKQERKVFQVHDSPRDKGRNRHRRSYIEQSPFYSHMCYLLPKHRIQGL